jgi:hypothetical protein
MSPYNTSWPNPSTSINEMGTGSMEEMMNYSKAQEDKFRIWDARIRIDKHVKYNDGVGNADYACTYDKKEKLKLQIAIIGEEVTLVPGIAFSGKLNCSGTRDDVTVLAEEHQLMLNNFQVTFNVPEGGEKKLSGIKTLPEGTKQIPVQWDFSPVE